LQDQESSGGEDSRATSSARESGLFVGAWVTVRGLGLPGAILDRNLGRVCAAPTTADGTVAVLIDGVDDLPFTVKSSDVMLLPPGTDLCHALVTCLESHKAWGFMRSVARSHLERIAREEETERAKLSRIDSKTTS